MVITERFSLQTSGHTDIIDITPEVARSLAASSIGTGICTVFISGSTAGITTIEYEPGLVKDLKEVWEKLVPSNIPYNHDVRWGDGNGFSHVRASMLGASLTVPFENRKLLLGVWQQIVVVDFDNRPRSRTIVIQFMGE